MILRNGKFYVDGKEVPLEIGNKMQIALLKNALSEAENGSAVEVNLNEKTTYNMSMSWKCCKCLKLNVDTDWQEYEDWEPDNDDIKEYVENNKECTHCGEEHELVVDKSNKYQHKYYLKLTQEEDDKQ
jgi:hypothetical protein